MNNNAAVKKTKLAKAIISLGKKLDYFFYPDGSTEPNEMAFAIEQLTQANNKLQLALSNFLYVIDGDK